MRGERRPPPPRAAVGPGSGDELRVCVNVPALNRIASQELYWPSQVGRCRGPPHSYVCMPFGLPYLAALHQCHMLELLATHEARHKEIQAGLDLALREIWGTPEPHEGPEPDDT